MAGDPVGRLGRLLRRASTAAAWRPGPRRTDAGGRHGCRPDDWAARSWPPSPTRRSRDRPGPIAWDRAAFDLDAARRDRRPARSRPTRGRRARRRLDGRGRVRPGPGPRDAPQRGRHRRPRPGLRRAGPRPRRRVHQRGLRWVARPRATAYAPDATPGPDQPVRGLQARRPSGPPRRRMRRAGGQLGIVRTAWLFGAPETDFPGRILAAAEPGRRGRRAAQGRRRRVGDAHVHARPGRGDRGPARRGRGRRDPPHRQRRRRVPGRLGPRRRPSGGGRRRRSRRSRPRRGRDRRRRRRGRSSPRRRCRSARRSGRGRTRWPTTRRPSSKAWRRSA